MLPRKYPSGSQKRNKRKRRDALIKAQRGALDKFFETSSSIEEVDTIENVTDALNENVALKKSETIDTELKVQIKKEKEHYELVLVRIISVVKYLVKHNLPFCGDNEKIYQNNNDNFLGLLELIANFDMIMQEHFRRVENEEIHNHYLSHNFQNELISSLASKVRSVIIEKIKEAKYYSVILDFTPNASHNEQMTLIIRCVDMLGCRIRVDEYFIEFLKVDDTLGLTFFNKVQCALESLDLDIDNVRGLSCENCSNMKGKHQGIQNIFHEINPRAFYMSHASHSLSLIICDMMTNSCVMADSFFGTVQRLYSLFAGSTKRWKILQDHVHQLTLKPLSTRWEIHINSIEAIITQPNEIIEALLELSSVSEDAITKSQAESLVIYELENFEFLLGMTTWYDILKKINLISKKLQSEDMQIDVAISILKGLISYFEKYRDEGFELAMTSAKELASKLDIDPVFPKKHKSHRKKQFDENCNENISLSAEASCRINYFIVAVDIVISSLKSRLKQLKVFGDIFGFLFYHKKLASLDKHTLHGCCVKLQDALKCNDKFDINADELCSELQVLQMCLPTKINSIIEVLEFVKPLDCFPNVSIAYRILLTIPITLASTDSSSSKLKLTETYLHSSVFEERLNGLAILSIENEILEKLDFDDLIHDFASQNAIRSK